MIMNKPLRLAYVMQIAEIETLSKFLTKVDCLNYIELKFLVSYLYGKLQKEKE